MKASLALALSLFTVTAFAEASLSGPASSMPSSMSTTTSTSFTPTTTTVPQAGTSAGSPQTAGPLNTAPNGSGGTYGYPNSASDPNTANPGLPQPTYFGGPYYNYGAGTVSGTTTSVNPAGAPFVTPPVQSTNGVTPAIPNGSMNH